MRNLDSLLKPKSVAVVGASRDRKKLGRLVLDNILTNGFKGKVYPVNPKAKRIGSLKCYPSVKDIPGKLDLAVISIPATFVYEVVKECCEKKVGSIAIISAGFSETGQEGLAEELKIKDLAMKNNVNILGPNCLGVISSKVNLNATFAKNEVKKGQIAFLSQSGALGTAALDWAQDTGVGFSHFISLGNKADLSEEDFLKYLKKEVKALAFYLEDFSNGRRFMKIASKVKKPILVLKPGKSEAAQKALGSHTGSLAQDYAIVSAALNQAGVLRMESIEELFNVVRLLSSKKVLKGNNIAIVTNAGGPGVFTTDTIASTSLKLATISTNSQQKLSLKLPASACVKNPVDVLGDALADRYKYALNIVGQDKNVDGIIVILTPQVMTEIEKTAKIITRLYKTSSKFILPIFMGGKEVKKGRNIFKKDLVPYFCYPEDAVRALSFLYKKRKKVGKRIVVHIKSSSREKVSKLLEEQTGSLDIQTSEKILKAYNIPLLESFFPQDIAAARRFADKLKYPIVMKLIHPELLHKTDVKAVKLDIKHESQLEDSFNELRNLGKKLNLENFRIQTQHFVKNALELIIGVKRDSDQYVSIGKKKILRKKGFGHSIVFGMGGIYTEVYRDVSLGIVPMSESAITKMINRTKVSKILKGARGKRYDLEEVKEVIAKLGTLVTDFPQLAEIDINPLFAKGRGVWVVDAKMIIGTN